MVNDEITIAQNERFLLQKEYLGENKPINQIQPIVSVTVATYQHVNYIKQCLDGILMQKTDFPYEIILGEDGSVDGTQEICKEYAEKYPDKIRLFIRDRKLSQYIGKDGKVTRFNGIWNRMSARGKYIAWCEGDDYWTDFLKLQKQIDFLEAHPNYGLVHGCVKVYNEKDKSFSDNLLGTDFENADQLIIGNRIVALSACFRTDLYRAYFRDVTVQSSWKMGDYPLWIYIALKSKVHFLNEVVGVYRVLENSASHNDDIGKEIDFLYNAYSISLFFAINSGKKSIVYKIRKNLLYALLYTYVVKNQKMDSRLWNIIKELKVFTIKGVGITILINSKCGRRYLKDRWR